MKIQEEEMHFKALKELEKNPELSQREFAKTMNLSLGKANYCIQALLEKGWIKVQNFKNSKNKLAYLYVLTPSGLDERARLTVSFLYRKMAEYDKLELEIDTLKREVGEFSKRTD